MMQNQEKFNKVTNLVTMIDCLQDDNVFYFIGCLMARLVINYDALPDSFIDSLEGSLKQHLGR